jgi:hypothetical protein
MPRTLVHQTDQIVDVGHYWVLSSIHTRIHIDFQYVTHSLKIHVAHLDEFYKRVDA